MTESSSEGEPQVKKVIVIYSPRSGRSRQFARSIASLRSAGVAVEDVLPVASLADLPPQGERWQAEGIDAVVVAGGDGLLGSMAAHVMPSGLPLGILPLGTSNDVARTVGIPMNIELAAALIRQGQRQLIDVGVADPLAHEPPADDAALPASRICYFVHALTIGLNVQFARVATRAPVRQHYGPLTYPYAIYHALRTYKRIEASIEFEDLVLRTDASAPPAITHPSATLHCQVTQISVVNASVFWGPLQARLPGASLYDRVLDIVVIEDSFLPDLRSHIRRLLRGTQPETPEGSTWHARYPELLPAQLTGIPGIHHVQARGVKIFVSGPHRDITLDGEVRGSTPVRARVAPQRLCLLAPVLESHPIY